MTVINTWFRFFKRTFTPEAFKGVDAVYLLFSNDVCVVLFGGPFASIRVRQSRSFVRSEPTDPQL